MTGAGKAQRPPAGEPWVWMTRDLLKSDAWQSLGINERRFIDFLLVEHMRHAGKRNGELIAPWEQLKEAGIGLRLIGDVIATVDKVGLVDCKRGTGRRPSVYALTWLPLCDGTEPGNRWQSYQAVALHEGEVQRSAEILHLGEVHYCTKVKYKARSASLK